MASGAPWPLQTAAVIHLESVADSFRPELVVRTVLKQLFKSRCEVYCATVGPFASPKLLAHQSVLKGHTPADWKISLNNMKSVKREKGLGSLAHV